MYYIGQVVRAKETGEAFIYWGMVLPHQIDRGDQPPGSYFLSQGKEVVRVPSGTEHIEQDGEILIGRFCRETDLVGRFFGRLDKEQLTPEDWVLIEETFKQCSPKS